MDDMLARAESFHEAKSDPSKKKKRKKPHKPEIVLAAKKISAPKPDIKNITEQPAIPKPGTELGESSKPAQQIPTSPKKAVSPGKAASDNTATKMNKDEPFGVRVSPSGEVLIQIADHGETVDSPKPAELSKSREIVNLEEDSSPQKQAGTALIKKRKNPESVADRVEKKTKGLKVKNRNISKKTAAASLQHRPHEKEVDESLITPASNLGEPATTSNHSLTVSEICRDIDSLQARDRLLDTPAANNEAARFDEEAAKIADSIMKEDPREERGLEFMRIKAERMLDVFPKPQQKNPLGDDFEQPMKPGDLAGSLPPLPSVPLSQRNLNAETGDQTADSILPCLESDLERLRDEFANARAVEFELRSVLEAERKERLENEDRLQKQIAAMMERLEGEKRILKDQVATIAAQSEREKKDLQDRLDREKKANKQLDGDCRYYRGKYLNLSRSCNISRPASDRPVAGETSNPSAKEPDRNRVTSEVGATRFILPSRIDHDAARLHSTFNLVHKNLSQMYVAMLQAGDQVARLGHDDTPSKPRPARDDPPLDQ